MQLVSLPFFSLRRRLHNHHHSIVSCGFVAKRKHRCKEKRRFLHLPENGVRTPDHHLLPLCCHLASYRLLFRPYFDTITGRSVPLPPPICVFNCTSASVHACAYLSSRIAPICFCFAYFISFWGSIICGGDYHYRSRGYYCYNNTSIYK
jgi:hypothetical protein